MKDETMGSGNVLHWVDGTKYVEVMFAKSVSEARECIGFLEDQLIPARLENTRELAQNCGVAVLVPADRFVDASELLAAREEEEGTDSDVESDDELEDADDDVEEEEEDEDDEFDDDEDDDEDEEEDEEEDFEGASDY
ncbi:MAG TPA: hypothetical protein VJZ71_18070 [Phycisphaerae bacterium]|nr:hypothetical protein [Phycisphaerae bacterium]